ncbi:hypothetical protein Daesc_008462 [Daldinia eschscholtzii]|uniref:Alpha/beta hydrolase fold-3 domain-containing protein n=1 Tax=Daldinia eschscholtzii TaxID=292717 RepID=A0AAX6MCI4_9PEZI
MILGPVSYVDCIVFCAFLAPQLIIHVGLLETVLPVEFIRERYFIGYERQSPFVQKASPFEDFVIRWGGFSMGSAYFYLEFLLTWVSLLKESGYRNPAIFALDYSLVPDTKFPTQLEEAIAGYEHVLSTVRDANRICVSGDSAGATIVLSLLLHLANISRHLEKMNRTTGAWRLAKPGMAVLISPWVTLVSSRHQNTASDYLNTENLHRYARQYAGEKVSVNDPLLSPGNCRDVSWWKHATPSKGIFVAYGAEEI